ncbi:MAG: hypothetical protein KAJ91_02870 [Candidatus Aenigmarchaeota archaeon]|nr:hypothetical protein [Candidatus Aenigmarchaeota archaeon]
MDGNLLKKQYLEEKNHLSFLNLKRMSEEIELSTLISNLNSSLMDLFQEEFTTRNNERFVEFLERSTTYLKHEYMKTKKLTPKEFYLWHISMFMTIRTYITIVESKYILSDVEEIEGVWLSLLKKEFFSFLEKNEELLGITGVKEKISKTKIISFGKYSISEPMGQPSITVDITKSNMPEEFAHRQYSESRDVSEVVNKPTAWKKSDVWCV